MVINHCCCGDCGCDYHGLVGRHYCEGDHCVDAQDALHIPQAFQ